jgi:hypothetical protein
MGPIQDQFIDRSELLGYNSVENLFLDIHHLSWFKNKNSVNYLLRKREEEEEKKDNLIFIDLLLILTIDKINKTMLC